MDVSLELNQRFEIIFCFFGGGYLTQIQENMKAVDVIPLLTPHVLDKIEQVIQSKPKRPESYR